MRVGGRTCLAALAICSVLGLPAGSAVAQKGDIDAAREAYKKAEAAMDKGDYEIAAREFGVAYDITKDPVLFYRIAEANDKAGDCETALVYYKRYLREGNPSEEYQKLTADAIAACEKKLGISEEKPDDTKTGPDDTKTKPDDTETPKPDVIEPPPEPDPPQEMQTTGPSWYRTAAWLSLVATGVFTTTGAVLGLRARDRQDRIDELFRDPDTSYDGALRDEYVELDREAYTANNYAVTAYIAAGAAGIATVTFFVLDATSRAGGDAGSDQGSVTLSPVITGDTVGVSTGWRF